MTESTRWEYLFLDREARVQETGSKPIIGGVSGEIVGYHDPHLAWSEVFFIRRPGSERELVGTDIDVGTVFDTLGREGWELVAESVKQRVLVNAVRTPEGPSRGNRALDTRWTFKRPA